MCMCTTAVLKVPAAVRRGNLIPGTQLMCGCETPCWYWETNTGSLQEQALLTTEPSLEPHPRPLSLCGQYLMELYPVPNSYLQSSQVSTCSYGN